MPGKYKPNPSKRTHLRLWRKDSGRKQIEMADLLGVSKVNVYRWEVPPNHKQHREASPELVAEYARKLGKSPLAMYRKPTDPPSPEEIAEALTRPGGKPKK